VIPSELSIFTGVSEAFRAPNLSDMTKMGDFGGGTSEPSAGIDPEHFTSYEFGINYTPSWGRLALTTYYTQGDDIISRPQKPTPTGSNAGSSDLYGFEFMADYYLTETLTLFGNISYVHGEEESFVDRDTTNGLGDFYISKMPPLSGQIGIRYEKNDRLWIECFVDMASKQDHLSPNDKDDNRIPPGGTPGYATVTLRGGYKFNHGTQLSVALENIGDIDYRIHGSGLNEPGRNLVITLQQTF
jgi:outer membrane receptor protein involved in Fe transport